MEKVAKYKKSAKICIHSNVPKFKKDFKNGIDIGYGGVPILPSSITLDQPIENRQYFRNCGNYPQQLQGDAKNLYWLKDGVLDYVYSFHVLEDFEDPTPVVSEWLRVIRKGGLLVLVLPDEQVYRNHCIKTRQTYNNHHKNENMSLPFMKDFFKEKFSNFVETVLEKQVSNHYSFIISARKKH